MSFPKYTRNDLIGSSFSDVSFADLAKYGNRRQDQDVSLFNAGDDFDSPFTAGTPSNVPLSMWGSEKSSNFAVGQKARVNVKFGFNLPDGSDINRNPSLAFLVNQDPFGDEINDFNDHRFIRDSTINAVVNSGRVWLWCEEDSTEYPSTVANTKSQRLMLRSNTTPELGAALPYLPLTHPKSSAFYSYNPNYGSTINQGQVYGVPEGAIWANASVSHSMSGSGTYYVFVGIAQRVISGQGFQTTFATGRGQWYGPFNKGFPLAVINTSNTHTSSLRSLSGAMTGLEDSFQPLVNGGNFADFEVEYVVEMAFYS